MTDQFEDERIKVALKHFHDLKSKKQWTTFMHSRDRVEVWRGPIHTNGQCERCTVVREYYNRFDGEVEWVDRAWLS